MGRYKRYPLETISAIKADRVSGMGLSDLMRKYRMSKTGIWHHVKSIDLTDEIRKEIRSYRGGSKAEKVREWARAQKQADTILGSISIASAWPVLYAALYWSEGTKSSFVFTNTDPKMVQVFLKILRDNLSVTNEELDFMIRTCTPMDPYECRKHWSCVAQVPISQVRVNHHNKHNKSHTEYGTCRITLKRGAYHLKLVHCLFFGIADKMLTQSPS